MLSRLSRQFLCFLRHLCQGNLTLLQTGANNPENTQQERALERKHQTLHLGLLDTFGDFNFPFTIEQWDRADLLKIDENRLVSLLFITGFRRGRPIVLRYLLVPRLSLIKPVFLWQGDIGIQVFMLKERKEIFRLLWSICHLQVREGEILGEETLLQLRRCLYIRLLQLFLHQVLRHQVLHDSPNHYPWTYQ